jgi:hypothetical protein
MPGWIVEFDPLPLISRTFAAEGRSPFFSNSSQMLIIEGFSPVIVGMLSMFGCNYLGVIY